MNLNSIYSHKRKDKLNKNILSTFQSQQQSLKRRSDRYDQLKQLAQYNNERQQNVTNNNNQLYLNDQIVYRPKRPTRNGTIAKKHKQQQKLIEFIKQKFSDDFKEEIANLTLNNKFKTHNLNMSINIHYNSSLKQGNPYQKKFKKSVQKYKTGLQQKQFLGKRSSNQWKINSALHKEKQIPSYEQIYKKKPSDYFSQNNKMQKNKQSKSFNLRQSSKQYQTINLTNKKAERYKLTNSTDNKAIQQLKYKSLDLKGLKFSTESQTNQRNNMKINSSENGCIEFNSKQDKKSEDGDKFIKNVSNQAVTYIIQRQKPDSYFNPRCNDFKNFQTKPRRILTQQSSKDSKKNTYHNAVYKSIDLQNKMNHEKPKKQNLSQTRYQGNKMSVQTHQFKANSKGKRNNSVQKQKSASLSNIWTQNLNNLRSLKTFNSFQNEKRGGKIKVSELDIVERINQHSLNIKRLLQKRTNCKHTYFLIEMINQLHQTAQKDQSLISKKPDNDIQKITYFKNLKGIFSEQLFHIEQNLAVQNLAFQQFITMLEDGLQKTFSQTSTYQSINSISKLNNHNTMEGTNKNSFLKSTNNNSNIALIKILYEIRNVQKSIGTSKSIQFNQVNLYINQISSKIVSLFGSRFVQKMYRSKQNPVQKNYNQMIELTYNLFCFYRSQDKKNIQKQTSYFAIQCISQLIKFHIFAFLKFKPKEKQQNQMTINKVVNKHDGVSKEEQYAIQKIQFHLDSFQVKQLVEYLQNINQNTNKIYVQKLSHVGESFQNNCFQPQLIFSILEFIQLLKENEKSNRNTRKKINSQTNNQFSLDPQKGLLNKQCKLTANLFQLIQKKPQTNNVKRNSCKAMMIFTYLFKLKIVIEQISRIKQIQNNQPYQNTNESWNLQLNQQLSSMIRQQLEIYRLISQTLSQSENQILKDLKCQNQNKIGLASYFNNQKLSTLIKSIKGARLDQQGQTIQKNVRQPRRKKTENVTNQIQSRQTNSNLTQDIRFSLSFLQNSSLIFLADISNLFIMHFNVQSQQFSLETFIDQIYFQQNNQLDKGKRVLLQAYALFLQQSFSQSLITIDQSLTKVQKPYLLKLFSLSLHIKIIQNNFYDAYHLLERLSFYGIDLKSSKQSDKKENKRNLNLSAKENSYLLAQKYLHELRCFEQFIIGVVLLMKRKLEEGVEFLLKAQILIEEVSLDQSFLNSDLEIITTFVPSLADIINVYLAYGYYCLNKAEPAYKCLQQQRMYKVPPNLSKIISYNSLLCQGLIQMKRLNFEKAIQCFKQSLKLLNRPQPHVYLALCNFSLWYQHKLSLESNQKIPNKVIQNFVALNKQKGDFQYKDKLKNKEPSSIQDYLQDVYIHLCFACNLVTQMNNNFASVIFYFRAIYYSWRGKWDLALIDIDQAIEKSEENLAKHFYLKSLILACNSSYRQAISQASIAISLNEKDYQSYLLRSKCCQLQGDQNQAFLDLQTYITLRPDDTQIHKYAGHLLFENGAFEDAILAYEQGQFNFLYSKRQLDESDFHVFLTRSKTYFLLGDFEKSALDMKKASEMKPSDSQLQFDYRMIKFLSQLVSIFQKFEKDSIENLNHNLTVFELKLKELDEIFYGKSEGSFSQSNNHRKGKIFKKVEFHILKFIMYFFSEKYIEASSQLCKCLIQKEASFKSQNLCKVNDFQQYEQEQNQKDLFVSQMHYNLCLVNIKMSNYQQAQNELLKCKVQNGSKTYPQWKSLLMLLSNVLDKIETKAQRSIQVYSDKNKLSKYFPQIQFFFGNKDIKRTLKLCIPYPKVQPPQISPHFDLSLLKELNQDQVEKKPEAPWITNEQDCIKFTEQIKTYSRLDINNSQLQSKKIRKPLGKNDKQEDQSYKEEYDYSEDSEQIIEKAMIKRRSSKMTQRYKKRQKLSNFSQSSYSSCFQKEKIHEVLKLNDSVQQRLKKIIH